MISTTRMTFVVAITFVSSGASYACQQTPAAADSVSQEPKHKAHEKLTEARAKVDTKIAEAHQEVTTATDEVRQATSEALANASDKVRGKTRSAADEHDHMRKWAQGKMDDVDRRIDAVRIRAQSAASTSTAKAHFNDAMRGVKHDRDALQTEMTKLDRYADDKYDKSKADFTAGVERIKTNIETIEKAL